MRISDWSSDVCSSDLRALRSGRDQGLSRRRGRARLLHQDRLAAGANLHGPPRPEGSGARTGGRGDFQAAAIVRLGRAAIVGSAAGLCGVGRTLSSPPPRSEERRVGKEGVSTWRFRGWPYHEITKYTKKEEN